MTYTIETEDKFMIVNIVGDIENDHEARELSDKITELANNGTINFCFNLQNATYLNSSGVSIFIHALAEVEKSRGTAYMVIGDSRVRNVVELAGLDKLIKTYYSMDDFRKEHFKD